jgi:hypothetical protein
MSKTPDLPSVLPSEPTPFMTIEELQSMDETALRSVTKALLERIKTDSQQIQTAKPLYTHLLIRGCKQTTKCFSYPLWPLQKWRKA